MSPCQSLQHCAIFSRAIALVLLGIGLNLGQATAQLRPDNTLGSENSIVTRNVEVQGAIADRIDGGAIRASTLFHSFDAFNVDVSGRVYFANPTGIELILSRVTGTDVSDILGTLGVDGQASLFLLNPNGIVFGDGATLDIRGSFLATTANGFTFPDGSQFSAVNPNTPPLLILSVTPGLQYGANPGAIANQGDLSTGRSLTLGAGSITHSGTLNADFGHLVLEAMTGNIVLSNGLLNAASDIRIQASDTVTIDDTAITADGGLQVQGDNAIAITNSDLTSGRDMVFQSPNRQLAGGNYTTGGYFVAKEPSGDVADFIYNHHDNLILADGDVELDGNYVGRSLYVLAGGAVTTGPDVSEITIIGRSNGTVTETISDGQGGTQNVTVSANNQPTVDIRSGIDWSTFANGAPGNSNSSPLPVTFGTTGGASGITDATLDLTNADSPMTLASSGGDVFLSNQFQPNPAFSGDITVQFIDTAAFASAGSVALDSRGQIGVNGAIDVSPQFFFLVNAGDVSLAANGDITLPLGARIESVGALGGDIQVISRQGDLRLDDSFMTSISIGTGTRSNRLPGDINLEAEAVRLGSFSKIANAALSGQQPGGNITINAPNTVEIISTDGTSTAMSGNSLINGFLQNFEALSSGTGIVTVALSDADAGNLTISTDQLTIQNNQSTTDPKERSSPGLTGLSSSTLAAGDAGDLRINANDILITGNQPGLFVIPNVSRRAELVIDINTGITSAGVGAGLPGNLIINTQTLSIANGAGITSGDVGAADTQANNDHIVSINAGESIQLTGKAVLAAATASETNSSNLFITIPESGQGLFLQDGAIISADTIIPGSENPDGPTAGAAGTVEISAPTIQLLNNARIGSASGPNGGAPGTIQIDVNDLEVINSLISTSSENETQTAGNIIINASESITLQGEIADELQDKRLGGILAEATLGGDAGSVTINTPQLQIGADGTILTSTNSGEGGDIQLQNIDQLEINNGNISASTQTGIAGSVSVNETGTAAEQIIIQGADGLIAAQSTGAGGSAGDVTINSQGVRVTDGAEISASNVSSTVGGNVNLNVQDLDVLNGAKITASTQSGTAGSVNINVGDGETAAESITVQGNDSAIAAQASDVGGDAGSVALNTQFLSVLDGASISASTQNGTAGSVTVDANGTEANRIELSGNNSIITAQATVAGGTAGDLGINSRAITIANGAELSTTNISSNEGSDIQLNGVDTLVLNNGQISASTESGVAGSVSVNVEEEAAQEITVQGSGSAIAARSVSGTGGNINLNTQVLNVLDGANVTASTQTGTGGDVQINDGPTAAQTVTLQGSGSAIAAQSVALDGDGNNPGSGDAGSVAINAQTLEVLDGASITTSTGSGSAGSIELDTQTLRVADGATITAETGTGSAGSVTIQADDRVEVRGEGSQITARANGRSGEAGNVVLQSPTIQLTDGAELSTSNISSQNGGNVQLRGVNRLILENSNITASTRNGVGGTIRLNQNQSAASQVQLVESELATEAAGDGNAGGIQLNTRSLSLDASEISASTQSGQSGTILFNGLSTVGLNNNSRVSASTQSGEGGNIRFNGSMTLELNQSEISASSQSGQGGNIRLNELITAELNNSTISASTGLGDAGNLSLVASDSIDLNQSRLSVEATQGGGTAGNLSIQTPNLTLLQSEILASTQAGEGGNITLQELEILALDDSQILAETETGSAGNIDISATQALTLESSQISAKTESGIAGNIDISDLQTLTLEDSQISAEAGTGTAGNLNISANNAIRLTTDSSLSVEAGVNNDQDSSGRAVGNGGGRSPLRSPYLTRNNDSIPTAGSLILNTDVLTVEDGSTITVSSPSGQAGNIGINAREMVLNAGEIRATTGVNQGNREDSATIRLAGLDFLFLQDGSLISAEANADAAGGNIFIDVGDGIILATTAGNNDIIATAVDGQGGNIEISALRLFGLQEISGNRADLRANSTNDISASSETGIDGTIVVRELAVDPSRGIAQLPDNLMDAGDRLEKDICREIRNSRFISVGRGGLSTTPNDLFSSDDLWHDRRLVYIDEAIDEAIDESTEDPMDGIMNGVMDESMAPDLALGRRTLVEAQRWQRSSRGTVRLLAATAQRATDTENSHNWNNWHPFLACYSNTSN